jgi:uncharacterized protein (DUF362 family)/Pyruvate/2-oxoacid:ferredoxin oxidoreductase delta subunit
VELIGGIGRFLPESGTVLLKPNLVGPLSRQRRATTDPEVVRAVAELFRAAGAERLAVGDSPAVGTAGIVMKRSGYGEVLPEWLERVAFRESRPHPTASHQDLKLAGEVLDAGTLVNLPKIKTHGYMGLTLAVKNLFGAVIGPRKAHWHLRAGENRELFARLLAEICYALRPALTVVDGVIAMEGNGPSNGTPRETGLIVAGDDPAAVDVVLCEILGFRPEEVLTLGACAAIGRGVTEMLEIDLRGETVEEVRVDGFRRARLAEDSIGIWVRGPLARFLKRALTSRPRIEGEACKLCGNCAEICPPKAITMDAAAGVVPVIDAAKCIRCFCCQEACPHNAISVRAGWLLRLLSLFRRQP